MVQSLALLIDHLFPRARRCFFCPFFSDHFSGPMFVLIGMANLRTSPKEHSAVIIKPEHQGPFELYTWGSAENGMLGLGRDMMSGVQSAPVKQSL